MVQAFILIIYTESLHKKFERVAVSRKVDIETTKQLLAAHFKDDGCLLEDTRDIMIGKFTHYQEEGGGMKYVFYWKAIEVPTELVDKKLAYVETYYESDINNMKKTIEFINTSIESIVKKQYITYPYEEVIYFTSDTQVSLQVQYMDNNKLYTSKSTVLYNRTPIINNL